MESVMSEIDIFTSTADNFNIFPLAHMKTRCSEELAAQADDIESPNDNDALDLFEKFRAEQKTSCSTKAGKRG
eukprot:16134837-Heterocapsa_arctica.AAC.1